jgi:thymidylate kinase
MACSQASREKGMAPLPAMAPNMTVLMTVPLRQASARMSNRKVRCARRRAASVTRWPS